MALVTELELCASLECGDLSPLLVPTRSARSTGDQSADKSAHSKEAPDFEGCVVTVTKGAAPVQNIRVLESAAQERAFYVARRKEQRDDSSGLLLVPAAIAEIVLHF